MVKELLEKVEPLVRDKSSIENIDRKIAIYTNQIKSLKDQKKAIMDNDTNEDEILIEVEAWADSLPDKLVADRQIRKLLTILEYLNN